MFLNKTVDLKIEYKSNKKEEKVLCDTLKTFFFSYAASNIGLRTT